MPNGMRSQGEDANRHISLGVGARLLAIRERLGLGQSALAAVLGVDQATVSRYEKGLRSPTLDVVIALERQCGVNSAYLLTGAGPVLKSDEPEADEAPPRTVQMHFVKPSGRWFHEGNVDETAYIPLPIVSGSVAAGAPRAISEHEVEDWVPAIYHPEWNPHPEKTVCVRVRGDSMMPTVPDGSLLAIDRAQREPVRLIRHMAAFRADGGVTVKRLFRTDKGLWIARPDNPDSAEIYQFDDEEIRPAIIGKVVWWWAKQ